MLPVLKCVLHNSILVQPTLIRCYGNKKTSEPPITTGGYTSRSGYTMHKTGSKISPWEKPMTMRWPLKQASTHPECFCHWYTTVESVTKPKNSWTWSICWVCLWQILSKALLISSRQVLVNGTRKICTNLTHIKCNQVHLQNPISSPWTKAEKGFVRTEFFFMLLSAYCIWDLPFFGKTVLKEALAWYSVCMIFLSLLL